MGPSAAGRPGGPAATACERLAAWAVGLALEDVPARVRRRAKAQLASVIAAAHAGADTAEALAVRRAVARWGRRGAATAMPGGERLPRDEAVLAAGAAAMVLDFDDYLLMAHTGHSAVLGALAACEEAGLGGAELLAAQIAANEVAGRLGASTVLGPQNGQAWSFVHAAAGAVVGARARGLDPARAADALAVALYQPPFVLWPGFMGPGSKAITAAGPTAAGLQAADFAAEGLTGARDLLEHPQGFWSAFAWAPLPGMLTGLGRAWVTDTLAIKLVPGCAYLTTTLEALDAALGPRPPASTHVRRVVVEASLLTVEMDNLSRAAPGGPLSPAAVNFSVPLSVAVRLVAGRLTAAELAPAWLAAHETEVRALAGRVTLVHDWRMTAQVAESLAAVLGPAGVLGAVDAGGLLAVLAGHRRRMAGRAVPVGARGLAGRAARRLARVVGALAAGRRPPDLAAADLTRFRWTLPAAVTVELDGEPERSARRDHPAGADGSLEDGAAKLRAAAPRVADRVL